MRSREEVAIDAACAGVVVLPGRTTPRRIFSASPERAA
jgi:hypothetical protein